MQNVSINIVEKWFLENRKELYHYALSKTGNDSDAEDIVQEVFASILAKKTDTIVLERAWLYSILKNKISDFHRNKRKDVANTDVSLEKIEDNPKNNPAVQVDQKEVQENIEFCISNLSSLQNLIFKSRVYESMDYDSIQKQSGVSSSNIRVIFHRAKSLIRKCLQLFGIQI